MKVLLGVFLLMCSAQGLDLRIDPLVLINQGLVKGQRASDGDYTTFLGIPYAEVDADNPFGPALPPKAFEDVIYKAYDGSITCPQMNRPGISTTSGSESLDCLRLNIYTPNDATSKNPLPVMVWFHGGFRFQAGSAGEYGVKNLVNQGIVVVTLNYRLGPYGFMCLDVPALPGNQGLKDQFAALKWIRNNIGAFGGNPYNVTIAGQSAGACSVLLHLYSSKEKLFHKVIVESGTPQNEGMFVNGDVKAAIKLAEQLGFNTTDTEQALHFLSKTPHNLVTAAASNINSVFRPCKERSFSGVDNFVIDDPFSLSNEKKVSGTPILIGHTGREVMNSLDKYYVNIYDSDPFYIRMAENFNLDEDKLVKVANTVRHYYIGDKTISEDVVPELEDFLSDFVFNHPMQRTITNLLNEKASPVYQYMFTYVGDSGQSAAPHGAELPYLFNMADEKPATEDDQHVSSHIVTMWSNFVKFGNPTPKNTLPVTWKPVNSENRPYLVIDKDLRMESRVYNDRMAFWDLFHDNYASTNKLARECHI